MKTVICPGSFDPITKGHLDIIQRASRMFDRVIVLVSVNLSKHCTFSQQERVDLIRVCIQEFDNVEVDAFSGLLADYVTKVGACGIVKGLRAVTDFENEFQQSLANKRLNPSAETVFLTTAAEHMFLSSSLVKQIAQFGGDISDFVPEAIIKQVAERLTCQKTERS